MHDFEVQCDVFGECEHTMTNFLVFLNKVTALENPTRGKFACI